LALGAVLARVEVARCRGRDRATGEVQALADFHAANGTSDEGHAAGEATHTRSVVWVARVPQSSDAVAIRRTLGGAERPCVRRTRQVHWLDTPETGALKIFSVKDALPRPSVGEDVAGSTYVVGIGMACAAIGAGEREVAAAEEEGCHHEEPCGKDGRSHHRRVSLRARAIYASSTHVGLTPQPYEKEKLGWAWAYPTQFSIAELSASARATQVHRPGIILLGDRLLVRVHHQMMGWLCRPLPPRLAALSPGP
jgi:hypothetical protein